MKCCFINSLILCFVLFSCRTQRTISDDNNVSEKKSFSLQKQSHFISKTPPLKKIYQGPSLIGEYVSWDEYCLEEDGNLRVNLKNQLVNSALENLAFMSLGEIAIYNRILSVHQGSLKNKEQSIQYILYLCGEYRDRPSMIQTKLSLFRDMVSIDKDKYSPSESPNIWENLDLEGYNKLVRIYSEYFEENVTTPLTVCEFRFIIDEYIQRDEKYSFETHGKLYQKYKSKCHNNDLEHYYVFRGDSLLTPITPESNGMNWYAHSIAMQCKNHKQAKLNLSLIYYQGKDWVQNIKLDNKVCEDYFKRPFHARWDANRASLGTLLFKKHGFGASEETYLLLYPNFFLSYNKDIMPALEKDNSVDFDLQWSDYWGRSDFGLGFVFSDNSKSKRLMNALNRHVNWKLTGYDDQVNQGRSFQFAFTPFVSGHYDLSYANQFSSSCDRSNNCEKLETDIQRHFLMVYKIKKEDWKTFDSLNKDSRLNFDSNWFEIQSFVDEPVDQFKNSWLRMGTILEHEYEVLLYLGSVNK